MMPFRLCVQSAGNVYVRDDIVSFVGTHAAGQFGILARAEARVAVLGSGLARFRGVTGTWTWLALPGGVLQFDGASLTITTLDFLVSDDRQQVLALLDARDRERERGVRATTVTLAGIDRALLRKLRELGSSPGVMT